jgi:hypothetical protein
MQIAQRAGADALAAQYSGLTDSEEFGGLQVVGYPIPGDRL